MRNTHKQIDKFHSNQVALTGSERQDMRDRRDANRKRLKKGLEANGDPSPESSRSQGSYSMWTMVQDSNCDYDIDDGVYFLADDLKGDRGADMSALDARKMVCEALQDDAFNTPPDVLKNCVRVYYEQGFHVDVPVYRVKTRQNWLTGLQETYYELASSTWEESDPIKVTGWFNDTNRDLSPDFDVGIGQFRRVVRLLKYFARSRSSWKSLTATGFMITKLTSECFHASAGRDDISLRETMRAIEGRLQWNKVINHPVLTSTNITRDNDPRPEHFRARLQENIKHLAVLDDAGCTHAQAMAAWDKVFARAWFCEEPESEADSNSPKSAVDKRGGGRYA